MSVFDILKFERKKNRNLYILHPMSYKQLKEMSEKHKIEGADNLSLFELKNKLTEAVRLPASSTQKA